VRPGANPSFEEMEETIGARQVPDSGLPAVCRFLSVRKRQRMERV